MTVGLTTNDEFESNIADDITFGWLPEQYYRAKEAKDDDAIIQPMAEFGWGLYSDLKSHKLDGEYKLSNEEQKLIARYILFLRSDYEYDGIDVIFANPLIRFSCKDFLLTILTLGKHYKKQSKKQKEIFLSMDKRGELEYWPFSSQKQFRDTLRMPLFLNGGVVAQSNNPKP